MRRPRRRWASLFVLIAILAVIAFPLWFFPHPHTNDAIVLADLEWPVLLVIVAGAVAAYFVYRGEVGATIRTSVGLLFLGSAIALVIGLFVFGNLSDDRFAPLLFFPPILALVGLTGIIVAVAAGSRHRQELLVGAFNGLAFALLFAGWTLMRGARAWLLAPYGFDLLLLLGVLGIGAAVLGTGPNVEARRLVGRLTGGPRRTGDRRRSK